MKYKFCQQCGNGFSHKNKCHHSVKTWETVKFCSQPCSRQHRKLHHVPSVVTKTCLVCSSVFSVKRYRKDTARFCSPKCSQSHRNKGKSTRYKVIRKSALYKAWRTLVFNRDKYTCQSCQKKGGFLHADHIKPFSLYPELRFDVHNGRTLCVPCHKATGTYGRLKIYL
jgi:Restriction endonuclease